MDARRYAWEVVPSLVDDEDEGVTRTVDTTDDARTTTQRRSEGPSWIERCAELSALVHVVDGRLRSAPEQSEVIAALRRLAGGWSIIVDRLHASSEVAQSE